MRWGGRGGGGTAVRRSCSTFAARRRACSPSLSARFRWANFCPICSSVRMRQAAAFAVPPFRILVRRRGLRVMTYTAVALGPFLHRHKTQRTLDCHGTQLARFFHFGSVPCTGHGSSPAASRRMFSAARGSSAARDTAGLNPDGRGRRSVWWCRSLPVPHSGLHEGGALTRTGGVGPLRHPSHPRAWGWRAVQSELGDGIS